MPSNLPQAFIFQQNKVRTIISGEEPWFVAKDVCKILGLNVHDAVTGKKNRDYADGLDDDEKEAGDVCTLGGVQRMILISEAGLYHLIFKSHKPEAKPFKRWVTHELIPTVRKTGAYITDRANPEMLREKADQNEKLADVNTLAQTVLPVYAAVGMKPQFQLLAVKQLYEKANIDIPVGDMTYEKQLYDTETIAKAVGIYSQSSGGKHPHAQAVYSIIKQLDILPGEKELVPFTRHGHSGTTYQFTAPVVDKVRKWLMENGYPDKIKGNARTYAVTYKMGGRASA